MNKDFSINTIEAVNELTYPDTLDNNIRLLDDIMQLFIEDKVQVTDDGDDSVRCLDYIRAINALKKTLVKLKQNDNETTEE